MCLFTRTLTVVMLAGFTALLGLVVGVANADTIYVCWDGSGDYLTIQQGIDAAADGDEVVVCDGVYTGPGNKNLDFGGKAITVRSENGPETCIIDCEGDGRGFYFHSREGPNSIVDGLTITNGHAVDGGGMANEASSPTLIDCTFSGNSAAYSGGGVYCYLSSPTLIDCTFSGNSATYGGGGMANTLDCSSTLINCTFSGNWAAIGGGGMYNWESINPTLINCTFSGNLSDDVGGGMFNWATGATVINCTLSGNVAYNDGAGMTNWKSEVTLTNCTLSGNVAQERGGAMYTYGPILTVTNCTFSGNSASNGGGMFSPHNPAVMNCVLWGDSPNEIVGPFVVTYSDVQGGWPGEGNIDADPLFLGGPSGTWTTDGLYDPQTHQVTFTDADASWSEGELVGKFVSPDVLHSEFSSIQLPIVANTATTITVWADWSTIYTGASWVTSGASYQIHDYHLTAGSPCIDAADNEAVPADEFDLDEDGDTDEPVPFDLDGNPRFVDDPATEDTGNGAPPIVDMGAYEFQGGILAFLDIKPGSCPNPLNRSSQGVLPVALVGTEDFDVTQVDLDSLELTRADGIGGSVTPLMGPPGPGIRVEDVATPFDGEPCDCHELEGDGIADLAMKFDTPEMVTVLELEDLAGGSSVELVVSGELLDTTHFSATDCVILVPPGSGPGALPAQSGPKGDGVDALPEPAPAARPDNPDGAQNDGTAGELSPPPVGCGVLPPGFLLTAAAGMYLVSRARPSAGRAE